MKKRSNLFIQLWTVVISFFLITGLNAEEEKSIKMAILLDTSNSMDGLIDQAKSQLWNIVNEMSKAKCDNTKANLKIALYEYGNSGLSMNEGYIRMVTPLTNDLDELSEDLFSLKTNGGQEYCGQVIQTALNELAWKKNAEDLQVIFIAGNEPFTQGNVLYSNVCSQAKERGIIVNTIFCGDYSAGISGKWKHGAILTGGEYFSIQQDKKTIHINSPYDDEIVKLNNKLNDTYVYYGKQGYQKKMLQSEQDNNAGSYGAANSVKRAVSKSSHVYVNSKWDLVDALNENEVELNEVDKSELPAELKNKNEEEIKAYIEVKNKEREQIKKQINTLNIKREKYVKEKRAEMGEEDSLDEAIIGTITKQAVSKNFIFE